ncbi:MAG TPA: DUF4175 family protein [Phycisphaerae bacterium]|nr:DUF4175 family protein [Phycisphaerae bacterium]
MKPTPRFIKVLWTALLACAASAFAQQDAPQPTEITKPLPAKQQMIQDRIRRLQDRMFRLYEKLAETEPDNAAKLSAALERIGRSDIDDKVEELVAMLADDAQLLRAHDEQEQLLADLEGVLTLLMQHGDAENRRQRIEQLRRLGRELEELLEEQQQQRSDASRSAAAARRAGQIGQALQRLDKLIEQQQAQREAADESPADQSPQAATDQQQLAEQADQLAQDVRDIEPVPDAEAAPDAQEPTGQAADSIDSAAENMRGAADKVEQGDTSGARQEQDQALDDLRRARHRLQEEAERLSEETPPGDPTDAGTEQRKTADKTGDLADRMKGAQPGGRAEQQPAPGQQNVEQAQGHMLDAADDLDRQNPDEATEDQDRAIDELNDARRQLEDELHQLRREERAELLRDLEGRFAEMLSRQLAINTDTVAIHARGTPALTRPDRLRVAELAEGQRELAAEAGTCLHILQEEGTTIAFPRVVEQIQQDMSVAADRLSSLSVGPLTQAIQEQIAAALRELIEAVQRKQDQEGQPDGQEGQPGDSSPLLPPSAELKLLRAAQVRINVRTATAEQARQAEEEPAQEVCRVVRQLEDRQGELARIASEMREQAEEQ